MGAGEMINDINFGEQSLPNCFIGNIANKDF
jgi:hypothetical protein